MKFYKNLYSLKCFNENDKVNPLNALKILTMEEVFFLANNDFKIIRSANGNFHIFSIIKEEKELQRDIKQQCIKINSALQKNNNKYKRRIK